MVTIKDLIMKDGTCYVPQELHDKDQEYDIEHDEILKANERSILDEIKNDPIYKDAEHKPFIDWVKLVGRKEFRALLMPGTRSELYAYIHKDDKDYKHKQYWNRCPMSNGRGGIKQCPMQIPNPNYKEGVDDRKNIANRCEVCSVYRNWNNVTKNTSLEGMLYNRDGEEIDFDEMGRSAVSKEDQFERIRDIVLNKVVDKDSKYYDAIKYMLDENLSIKGASDRAGINNSSFDKALKTGSLGKSIIEALEDDPLVDLIKLLY